MSMTQTPEGPHVDMQTVTDTMAVVYEAIATLEYAGHDPGRGAIAEATRLPDQVLEESLASMTRICMLRMDDRGGEPVYTPSRRGWSTMPDQAEGQKLS
jgi:hypothetical protein